MSTPRESAGPASSELVLVDTSVWVRFFRSPQSTEARVLDMLLSFGPVATCAPIRAEIVSGARRRREFNRLREFFDALISLEPPAAFWSDLEEHRFALARRGYRAALVDLMVALAAQAHQAPLWTLDEDFRHIAKVIPFLTFDPANFSSSPSSPTPSRTS